MAILDKRKDTWSNHHWYLSSKYYCLGNRYCKFKWCSWFCTKSAHAFTLDFSLIATAGFIGVAFAFLFVDFFDTAGTLTSVANLTGKVNKKGEVEGIDRAPY